MLTDPGPVARYIRDRDTSELAFWDVLFTSVRPTDDPATIIDHESTGLSIYCQRRTAGSKSDNFSLRITNKQRVASRGIEKTGLSEMDIERAESKYREVNPAPATSGNGGRPLNYPDLIYRNERTRPLLIVHLLRVTDSNRKDESTQPIVAYSISFPRTSMDEKRVEYIVNTTWLRENFPEEFEPEDDEFDNDK